MRFRLWWRRRGSDRVGCDGRGSCSAGGEIFEKWKPIRFQKDQRLRPHKRLTEVFLFLFFFSYLYRAVFSLTPKNAPPRLYDVYMYVHCTHSFTEPCVKTTLHTHNVCHAREIGTVYNSITLSPGITLRYYYAVDVRFFCSMFFSGVSTQYRVYYLIYRGKIINTSRGRKLLR